eukprot:1313646-Rhodomonas_salina.1
MPLQRLHHLPRLARLPCSEPEPGPELDCVVAGACGKERTRQTHGHAHARHAVLVSLPDVAAHFLASPARARCRNPLEEHAPSVEALSKTDGEEREREREKEKEKDRPTVKDTASSCAA